MVRIPNSKVDYPCLPAGKLVAIRILAIENHRGRSPCGQWLHDHRFIILSPSTLTRLAVGFGWLESPYCRDRSADSPHVDARSSCESAGCHLRWFPRFSYRKFSDIEWIKYVIFSIWILRYIPLSV